MLKKTETTANTISPFTLKGTGATVQVTPALNSLVTPYNVNAFLELVAWLEGSQRLHLILNKLTFAYMESHENSWPDEDGDFFELQMLTHFVSALYRKPTARELERMEMKLDDQ